MYSRARFLRALRGLVFVSVVLCVVPSFAQDSSPSGAPAHDDHDMPMPRELSGTAWLPDASPMYAVHVQRGVWQLMAHGNAFLQFLNESSPRVDSQTGSINWIMGMAERNLASGHLRFRGMLSAEPWTIGGCGYPDLLASGERCGGEPIHDRQHQHDLVMELAADYEAPLKGRVRWQVYGGPVGEPALGPVAYPHRISAMPNPLAPIGHHWFDSTHVTFGVVTAGVFGDRWKIEGSAFNGREPDEERKDFDFGPLDSVSARLWWLPASSLALQVSAGRLKDAEMDDDTGGRRDVNRITATATYHRLRADTIWASTVGWGRNSEAGHATNAVLAETSFTLSDRDAWFGRVEVAGKTAHDLDAATRSEDVQTVAKIQGGYTRYLPPFHSLRVGLGAEASAGFVPRELRSTYGGRVNGGAGVFLTARPAMMPAMAPAAPSSAGGGMVMVQTAFDPAKLSCSPPIDPRSAASTVFEGRTYYFCSEAERDEFLKDPKMSLMMMPPRE